jgi:hypothetical protein
MLKLFFHRCLRWLRRRNTLLGAMAVRCQGRCVRALESVEPDIYRVDLRTLIEIIFSGL